MADLRTGGCTAVQRFGSSINLNVHFHTLVPDGVFDLSRPGRGLFVRLPAPSEEELERLCRYAVRPPFALHRLSQGPDGKLLYKMKRPRSGASKARSSIDPLGVRH